MECLAVAPHTQPRHGSRSHSSRLDNGTVLIYPISMRVLAFSYWVRRGSLGARGATRISHFEPNYALQRMAPGWRACCSPAEPTAQQSRQPCAIAELDLLGVAIRCPKKELSLEPIPSIVSRAMPYSSLAISHAGQAGAHRSPAASSVFHRASERNGFGRTYSAPNCALQRMAPFCHACCSPQNPPRSSHASPPPSLSLIC